MLCCFTLCSNFAAGGRVPGAGHPELSGSGGGGVRGRLGLLGPQLGVPKPDDAGAGAALPHCARYCADQGQGWDEIIFSKNYHFTKFRGIL